ncbi:MAG: GumC family protein [Candidatus Binatia bacterium]
MSDDRQLSPYRIEPNPPSTYFLQSDGRVPGVVEFHSYWRVIYKRRLLIFLVTSMAVILAALANRSAPEVFVASTQIRIDPAAAEFLSLSNAASPVVDYSYYESEYEELRSSVLARRVIEALKLYDDPRFIATRRSEGVISAGRGLLQRLWPASKRGSSESGVADAAGAKPQPETAERVRSLVGTYLSHLTITPVASSRLVTISFASYSPEVSAEIANRHAQEFVQLTIESRTHFYAEAQQFLEARLAEIKKKTEASEAKLNDFRRHNRVLAVGGNEKENVTLERLSTLNADYVKAQSERIAAEADYNLVKKRRYDSLATVQRDPVYNSLKQELEALQSEHSRLAQFFQPKYPKMVDLAGQIEALQRRLNAQIKGALDGVESQYLAAKEKETALAAEVETQRKDTLDLNDLNVEFQVLDRDAEANRELYKNLLARAKETSITQSMATTNVRIVAPAEASTSPSLTESRRRLTMALLVGLVLGCGIAFGLEHLDNSVKTPEDAEALFQVPSLAVIPSFSYEKSEPARRSAPALPPGRSRPQPALLAEPSGHGPKSSGAALPALASARSGAAAFDAGELVVAMRPSSVIAEAYRTLRTAVLLSSADKPPQVIQFVSAESREGKTVTTVNVAITLAQSGARVLIVDGDLRRPRCHRILRTAAIPGLVDLLVGHADFATCVHPVKLQGVDPFHAIPADGDEHGAADAANGKRLLTGSIDLIAAGSRAPNPTEILGSRRMREMMRAFREMYDYVVVDSPPLLPVADSVILSTMVDGVVLVIKGQATAVPAVRKAMARLERVNARVLGTVLNNVDVTTDDYYDYRGYYSPYDYLEGDDRPRVQAFREPPSVRSS